MYELKNLIDTSKPHVLEDEKAERILESIACLGTHMHTYFFYQIVKRNLDQLLNFIENAQNTLQKIDILECNRLLFNFADSFFAYINFFESNYKEAFEPIKKDLFDNNFEYAFIYKLRNYIIHEDLPIFKLSREVGENYIKSKFIISKKKFLSSTRIGTSIKMRIFNHFPDSDNIDIAPILILHKDLIFKIQIEMLTSLADRLLSAFKYLRSYILNNEEMHIELCNVPPLGDFLEIETIKNQTDDETVKKIKKLQEQIFTQCDISLDQIEERFYRDLLAEIKN
jgi:hypothetical protein